MLVTVLIHGWLIAYQKLNGTTLALDVYALTLLWTTSLSRSRQTAALFRAQNQFQGYSLYFWKKFLRTKLVANTTLSAFSVLLVRWKTINCRPVTIQINGTKSWHIPHLRSSYGTKIVKIVQANEAEYRLKKVQYIILANVTEPERQNRFSWVFC